LTEQQEQLIPSLALGVLNRMWL